MEAMLAKSAERECYSVDGGTFHFEWCARSVPDAEREMLPLDDRFRAIVGVYRRRIDTPVRTDADGLDWIQWRLYSHGPTLQEACAMMGDGSWYAAESLHSAHTESVAKYRRHLAKNKAMQTLRAYYNRQMETAQEAKNAAQRALETAMKRARIYKLALEGKAPQAKVDELKARVRAEYMPTIEQATARALTARTMLERQGFNPK